MFVDARRGYARLLCWGLVASLAFGPATAIARPLSADKLTKRTKSLALSNQSLAIFTVVVTSEYKPRHPPSIHYAALRRESAEGDEIERYFIGVDRYAVDHVGGDEARFVMKFSAFLPAGRYQLYWLSGLEAGNANVPLFDPCTDAGEFELVDGQVVYLGHLEIVLRERTDDSECRAGPAIPLVDQAIYGLPGGTFFVSISDQMANDMETFVERYPVLEGKKIVNATLSEWTKPQAWHGMRWCTNREIDCAAQPPDPVQDASDTDDVDVDRSSWDENERADWDEADRADWDEEDK